MYYTLKKSLFLNQHNGDEAPHDIFLIIKVIGMLQKRRCQ